MGKRIVVLLELHATTRKFIGLFSIKVHVGEAAKHKWKKPPRSGSRSCGKTLLGGFFVVSSGVNLTSALCAGQGD